MALATIASWRGLHACGRQRIAECHHIAATGLKHRLRCGGTCEFLCAIIGTLAAALELPGAVAVWHPVRARRSPDGCIDTPVGSVLVGVGAELVTRETLCGPLDFEELVHEGRETRPEVLDLVGGDLERPWIHGGSCLDAGRVRVPYATLCWRDSGSVDHTYLNPGVALADPADDDAHRCYLGVSDGLHRNSSPSWPNGRRLAKYCGHWPCSSGTYALSPITPLLWTHGNPLSIRSIYLREKVTPDVSHRGVTSTVPALTRRPRRHRSAQTKLFSLADSIDHPVIKFGCDQSGNLSHADSVTCNVTTAKALEDGGSSCAEPSKKRRAPRRYGFAW
jgi:hypothetical protein